MTEVLLDSPDQESPSPQREPKAGTKLRLVNFFAPRHVPKIEIPRDTKHVILGFPGLFCTSAALRDAQDPKYGARELGIHYIDWGQVIDLGMTKPISSYIVDYAKEVAQTFGGSIDVHGNSYGRFLAQLVTYATPDCVGRVNVTAGPRLGMRREDLLEHTNIEPFLTFMNGRLRRFYDTDHMKLWQEYLDGKDSPEIDELRRVFDTKEFLFVGATRDTTVNGKLTVEADSHNKRSHAIEGDHVDVFRAALPLIFHLTGKPLHSELPAHLEEGLVSIEEIEPLVHTPPRQVAYNFVRSSIPTIKPDSKLHRIANAPRSLVEVVSNFGNQDRDLGPSDAGLFREQPGLALIKAK